LPFLPLSEFTKHPPATTTTPEGQP
jgi:hypothetical protein